MTSLPYFHITTAELLHLRRKKYRFNGRLIFEWEQTLEDVNIWIKPPANITAKQLDIRFDNNSLRVGLKGRKPFINDELAYKIDTTKTTWFLDDEELTLTLGKLVIGDTWPKILKKQKALNMFEEERMKKSMLLERFARENPGMDFSQAKFDGQCPDPNKFIDGIDMNRFHT